MIAGRASLSCLAALALLISGCGGCGQTEEPAARQPAGDAVAILDAGETVVVPAIQKSPVEDPEPPPDKISPGVLSAIERGVSRLEVVILFEENIDLPRFPDPEVGAPRTSPRNQAAQAEADALVRRIREARSADYEELVARLAPLEVDVRDRFWLVRGVEAIVPASAVERLAGSREVSSIELVESPAAPPAHRPGVTDQSVDHASAWTGLDQQRFNLPQQAGGVAFVGILDTGVRRSHKALVGRVDIAWDCVQSSGGVCREGVGDPGDGCDHGTATAAIISGRKIADSVGKTIAGAGLTPYAVDSFKVFKASGGECAGTRQDDIVRAFESAIQKLDKVILVEVQRDADVDGTIARQVARAAGATGSVVIAPVGNRDRRSDGGCSGPQTPSHPAINALVIAVGSRHLRDGSRPCQRSSSAPKLQKPEVEGPTVIVTAAGTCDTCVAPFTGTSAAGAYLGGAALLTRAWLEKQLKPSRPVDPGDVAAQLILASVHQNPSDRLVQFPGRNAAIGRRGLEPVKEVGSGARAKAEVANVAVPPNATSLTVAIWWPAPRSAPNPDVDLELIPPTSTGTAASASAATTHYSTDTISVSERVRIPNPRTGTWTVRMRRADASLAVPSQSVYFAVGLSP